MILIYSKGCLFDCICWNLNHLPSRMLKFYTERRWTLDIIISRSVDSMEIVFTILSSAVHTFFIFLLKKWSAYYTRKVKCCPYLKLKMNKLGLNVYNNLAQIDLLCTCYVSNVWFSNHCCFFISAVLGDCLYSFVYKFVKFLSVASCHDLQLYLKNVLQSWYNVNGMVLNNRKWFTLTFTLPRNYRFHLVPQLSYSLFARVLQIKDLSVLIDQKLSFIPILTPYRWSGILYISLVL